MTTISVERAKALKSKPQDETKMGFGQLFTDHMFSMNYSPDQGWHNPRVEPYHMLEMDPATMVLHYGQAIFEGLKCYRRADQGLQLFRPRDNFHRLNLSADRLSIPMFNEDTAMDGFLKLLELDGEWTPHLDGSSLYVRPTIIAIDPFLGVRASNTYLFFIILSPSGSYYAGGLQPVSIYVEDQYVRAVRGGLGFTKAAANYAASIKAADIAKQKGFAQVLWLDGVDQKYIEEVGSMNIMFVIDGKLVTPELNGSILAGITRDSILTLARDMGMTVEERRVSIEEIASAARSDKLQEAFGTGTAAVVSPVGELCYEGEVFSINGKQIGPVTQKMYDTLTGIQYGRISDPHGWILPLK